MSGQTVNGLQWGAGITQTRTYNNVIINSFNPYYQATLSLSVTQPLLKNAGMNAVKHQLKLAMIGADSDEAQALVDASTTIAQVEDTYWDLVAAWRNVAIQEDALNEAVVQQRASFVSPNAACAAQITAIESETQVANFQADVFSALQAVSELQTQLKSLIVADPGDPIWRANLVPSSPVQQLPTAGDLAEIVALAEQRTAGGAAGRRPTPRRRSRHGLCEEPSASAGRRRRAVFQQRLRGHLTAGSEFRGPACCNLPGGTTCPTPPPQSQGNMTQAFHNMWTGAYPEFNIAFVVNIPLENNTARGLKQIAGQEQDQARVTAPRPRSANRKRGAQRFADLSIGALAPLQRGPGARGRGIRLRQRGSEVSQR